MPVKPDAEEVRKALQKVLKGDPFKEVLRQVYIEKNDLDRYVPPEEVYNHSKFAPQIFPCGEIELGRGAKRVENQLVHDVTWRITLYWHIAGDDEEVLEDHCSRYARATQDYFSIPGPDNSLRDLRPYLYGCNTWTVDEDYSPTTPHDDKGYIKSVAIDIRVLAYR